MIIFLGQYNSNRSPHNSQNKCACVCITKHIKCFKGNQGFLLLNIAAYKKYTKLLRNYIFLMHQFRFSFTVERLVVYFFSNIQDRFQDGTSKNVVQDPVSKGAH